MFRLNWNKQKTNWKSLIGSIFCYFLQKILVFPFFSQFFQFCLVFSVCFEIVCFGCFASIPKQIVSMFRLNWNKQKTHPNSLKESIFGYFSENVGLFWFVTKQFCLFRLFLCRFETPKQTEIFSFWFHKTNRNNRKTDFVSVCFGSNQNLFCLFRGHPSMHIKETISSTVRGRPWHERHGKNHESFIVTISGTERRRKITLWEKC